MSDKIKYKQDMPPPGGYGPIDWMKKQKPKQISGMVLYCTMLGIMGLGYALYVPWKRNKTAKELENMEARIAITPFLVAERNRLFLSHIARNRKFEEELMKDVEGWEVGKWYDYPVFHNPRGLWIDPSIMEFYAHLTGKDTVKYRNFKNNYI